jgi:hypothetical protein
MPTNPTLSIGTSLDNNWVGYITHNIGHTNYALSITPVPYEFWTNCPANAQWVNDVVCRVIGKRSNECIFQINKTDGTRLFQEIDFVLYGTH